MKSVAKLILPLAAILAAPAFAFPSPNQEVTAEVDGDDEPGFPWPDFLSVTPQPGAYDLEMRITGVEFPEGSGMEFMADVMMDEEPEVESYCLTGEPERVDWVNEFMDGDCTGAEPQLNGNSFTQRLQCQLPDDDTPEMILDLAGDASDQGMDLDIAMLMRDPTIGKVRMTMEVNLQRIGDCE